MNRIQQLLDAVFDTRRYTSLVDKERARAIYFIISSFLGLSTLVAIFVEEPTTSTTSLQRMIADPAGNIQLVLFYGLGIATLIATRRGWLNVAALGAVIAWTLGGGLSAAMTGLYSASTGIILVVTVILSALLLRTPGLFLGLALSIGLTVVGLAVRAYVPPPPFTVPISELVATLLMIGLVFATIWGFIRFNYLARQESVLLAAEERLKLAEVTSQITRRISSRMSLDDVLNEAINYVVTHYPEVYHAQIFLVDADGRQARLAASTGTAGRKLLEQGHALGVGSQSVIGQVTASGQALVARAQAAGSIHRPNEYLPETRAEAAYPLVIGQTVIGALDLQSKNGAAFADSEQPIFRMLADHIAIAIDNARLFEETERRIAENARLATQAQETLHQVERLNQRLTGQAWVEFLGGRAAETGLAIDFESGQEQYGADLSSGLLAAAHVDAPVEQEIDGQRVLIVPVRVRGEVIGAMEFELDASGALSAADRALVENISERLGLAAENIRLFAESQRLAQREALINEVGVRLQTTSSVEGTLTEAARSLQQMLKAGRVSIRLGEPPSSNGGGNGKDSAG
jgi:GAF domain-containing protein